MTSVLDQIGGEDALRDLVKHFYDLVETLPETHQLRVLHQDGHGFSHTRVQQFDFLSGFMGGRPYFMKTHRHMNVKEIHAHVPINSQDAEVWLQTMSRALDDLGHTGAHIERLRTSFRRVAMILVNDGEVVST